ncbi:MAG: helix-turn-helix transcriptional regulator [Acidovorax temperans]|uniref:helix-turn-helix transcriptional regulator n=1 Tax=Acidovorax temperans TaxID=80878 RepID=UPI00391D953C
MPAQTTRNTLARLWELLKCLPKNGSGKSAQQLSQDLQVRGFSVSKRQVERDLHDLSASFSLHCNRAGTPYGWRWANGAQTELAGMDVAEALSLHLAESAVRPLLPNCMLQTLEPKFKQAHAKLQELSSTNPLCHWQDKVRSIPAQLHRELPNVNTTVASRIHEGLLNDEQLDVEYTGMGATAATPLRLHPLALIQRGPLTYLAATAWEYEDIRLYALHRITAAQRTYTACNRPEDGQLDTWLQNGAAQFNNHQTMQLRIKLSEDLLRLVAESPLSTDQVMGQDTLQATVQDSWELRWWILSQGAGIEVLEPMALREEIAQSLRDACKRYDTPVKTESLQ